MRIALIQHFAGHDVEENTNRGLEALGGAEVVVVPQAGSVGEWPDGLYADWLGRH